LLATIALLSVLLVRTWRKRGSSSSVEVQIVKIVVSHLQSIAIVGAVQLRWPDVAATFLSVVDTASSFTTSGLAVECLFDGNYPLSPFLHTAVVFLLPLGLLVFAALLWASIGAAESRGMCSLQDETDTSGPTNAAGALSAPVSPRSGSPCVALWAERMFVSVIILAFLVHTPVSSAAFRLLTCRSVHPEDDSSASQLRLAMDLDVRCTDAASLAKMLVLAVPVIVLVRIDPESNSATQVHAHRFHALATAFHRRDLA
jgi:hypothetical protein